MIHTRSLSRRTRGRHVGFTLIEVLVAAGLVAVVIPIVMAGISLSLRAGSAGRRRAEAATLAQGKLDELTATDGWQTGPFSGDFGADWPAYRWTANVQPWTDGTMNELDVVVTWTARQRQESFTVATLVNPATTEGF